MTHSTPNTAFSKIMRQDIRHYCVRLIFLRRIQIYTQNLHSLPGSMILHWYLVAVCKDRKCYMVLCAQPITLQNLHYVLLFCHVGCYLSPYNNDVLKYNDSLILTVYTALFTVFLLCLTPSHCNPIILLIMS